MTSFDEHFDVVVVGGGHAGCEAALAAAGMGATTALFTLNLNLVAEMPCNPAVGGIAKGHLVREIDALGGVMGAVADRTGIQFRLLNASRGPAVQAPRCQSDKSRYSKEMRRILEARENLSLCQGEIVSLVVQDGEVRGVEVLDGRLVGAGSVVLTTGTFLDGLVHVGDRRHGAGRNGESASVPLARFMKKAGFRVARLKTGTPPRLDGRTIDYGAFAAQAGDADPTFFSFETENVTLPQVVCHVGYTNDRVHDLLRTNLGRSPLYSGVIVGIGPRYCPSIEDKVVKFADKDRHQIFLEPEGLDTHEVYLNGMSTSMPVDVQQEMVRRVAGLEKARMIRPGYAIEYDFVDPTELTASLETRRVARLFHAGQINGTTGYEEAAAQGLVAGINAALRAAGKEPIVFSRLESYIGIMVDDLVTKGVDEPYRMFTSRSELRLLLRIDNADRRLTGLGHALGLISSGRYARFVRKYGEAERALRFLKNHRWDPAEADCPGLSARLDPAAVKGMTLEQILRRPGIRIDDLQPVLDRNGFAFAPVVRKAVEIEVRYEGYITQQERDRERLGRAGSRRIPDDLDYAAIDGLSREVREKLARVRPRDLGMASRVPGVTPAAVSILNVHLELRRRKRPGGV